MAGGVKPDSRTGVLISNKEIREVIGRIGRWRGVSPRRSGRNAGGGDSRCLQQGLHGLSLGSIRTNKIRRNMRRPRSVLFRRPAIKEWVCVATAMAMLEMLPVWRHMNDVLIANLKVRLEMSTRTTLKGGGDEIWGSKPMKTEVSKTTKIICRVWQAVSKIDSKGICSLH